jgi:prepilin-type N-terminal cleavage/methylation domain-containing protein
MLQKLRKNNQKGFTLIELMIVIAIIGILAAIAIPNFLAYRTRGQDSAAQSEAKNFYNAAMAYFADTTTTGSLVTEATAFGAYVEDVNVDGGNGTMGDNMDGTVTLNPDPLLFSHTASASIFELDPSGNVTKQ